MFIEILTMAGKNVMAVVGKIPAVLAVVDQRNRQQVLRQHGHLRVPRQPDRQQRLRPVDSVRRINLQADKARPTSRQTLGITSLPAWTVRTIPGNGLQAGITSIPSSEVVSIAAGQVVAVADREILGSDIES